MDKRMQNNIIAFLNGEAVKSENVEKSVATNTAAPTRNDKIAALRAAGNEVAGNISNVELDRLFAGLSEAAE
jgi:hypothetical protein